MNLIIGIDASRNRSGGARAHVIGIIGESDPRQFGISEVHIWSYKSLLDSIPDRPWLVKHSPIALEKSLIRQIFWQATVLGGELRKARCQILFSTDATTLCSFRPHVVMSQDLLSFEPGMMSAYGLTGARFRLELILRIQKWGMQRAAGVIFLTKYAGTLVRLTTSGIRTAAYIPHGVGAEFAAVSKNSKRATLRGEKIRCLYISNAEIYKNHPQVIAAAGRLVSAGHAIELTLVGGGVGEGLERLNAAIAQYDPERRFVKTYGFVEQATLPEFLSQADIFIFASSCENFPVTLIEAMAAGVPIACSNCGPMPEVLGNTGLYFDPLDPKTIAAAVAKLIDDDDLREKLAAAAKNLARRNSWSRCGAETWAFAAATYRGESRAPSAGEQA